MPAAAAAADGPAAASAAATATAAAYMVPPSATQLLRVYITKLPARLSCDVLLEYHDWLRYHTQIRGGALSSSGPEFLMNPWGDFEYSGAAADYYGSKSADAQHCACEAFDGELVEDPNLEIRDPQYYGREHIYIRTLQQSPLIVPDPAAADVIVVPLYAHQAFLGFGKDLPAYQRAQVLVRDTLAYVHRLEQSDPLVFGAKPKLLILADASDIAYPESEGGFVGGLPILSDPLTSTWTAVTSEMLSPTPNAHNPPAKDAAAVAVDREVVAPYYTPNMLLPGGLAAVGRNAQSVTATVPQVAKSMRYLAGGVFSLSRKVGPADSIRQKLHQQCVEFSSDEPCVFQLPERNLFAKNVTKHMALYQHSWFCLVPPGDTYTRSAYVDCIAALSIPVFFTDGIEPFLPYADVLDYDDFSVNLGSGAIDAGDVMSRLHGISLERRLSMLEKLILYRPAFMHSVAPQHLAVRFDEMHVLTPFDDAFTFTLKAVMRNMCRRGKVPAERCKQQQQQQLVAGDVQQDPASQV
jgi:hypothetical protein